MKILEVLYHNNKPCAYAAEGFYCGLVFRAGVGRGHGGAGAGLGAVERA